MEKYTSFERFQKKDIAQFSGLENEVLTRIYNSDPNAPLSIKCFGITNPDPNYYIRRDNSTYFILEYVVSGKGYIVVNGKKHTVQANDAYLLEPGSSHEYYADKDDPYSKIWVNFKSELFESIMKLYNMEHTYVFHNADISKEMNSILKLENTSIYNHMIYQEASRYLFSIFMTLAKQKQDSQQGSMIAQQILVELDRSVYSSVTIEDICKQLYISRSKMMREFKKYYHTTPHAYLLEQKIKTAKTYLKNTNNSIKDIANYLGFENEHYFSTVFKAKTGMTPGQYRRTENDLSR